jgi:hypothetical protein
VLVLRQCIHGVPGSALPPAGLGLLPGSGDDYIVTDGGLTGQRGFLTRDANRAITGADLAGRLFNRVPATAE